MKKKPLISVIIPVYNQPGVYACIRSLLNQDYPADRFEILVINNNSTDSTPGILRKYKNEIILLSERKQGSYAARNKGLERARGSVLAFTDSDCIQRGDWLSKIAESFCDDTISAVQGISYGINKNTFSRFINQMNIQNIYKKRQKDGFLTSLNTRNCAIKKEQLKNLRFDDTFLYWADFIMGLEIVRSGGKISLNEEMINFHCNIRNIWKYIRKNFDIGASICKSLQSKPMVLKQYLNFLAPVFKADFSFGRILMTLSWICLYILRFYCHSFFKNDVQALESLQQISALSFSWGLNCVYSRRTIHPGAKRSFEM